MTDKKSNLNPAAAWPFPTQTRTEGPHLVLHDEISELKDVFDSFDRLDDTFKSAQLRISEAFGMPIQHPSAIVKVESADTEEPKVKENREVAPAEAFEAVVLEMAREIVSELTAEYLVRWKGESDEPLVDPRLFEVRFTAGVPEFISASTEVANAYAGNNHAKAVLSKLFAISLQTKRADAVFFACEGWSKQYSEEERNLAEASRAGKLAVRDTPGRRETVFCLATVRRGTYMLEQTFENGKRYGEMRVVRPEDGHAVGRVVPE